MAKKCSTTEELTTNDDDPITSPSIAANLFVPAYTLKKAAADMAIGSPASAAASASSAAETAAVAVEVDGETTTTTATTTNKITSKPAEIEVIIAATASDASSTPLATTTTRRMSHNDTGSGCSSISSGGEYDDEVAAAMDRILERLLDGEDEQRATEVTPTSSAVSSTEEYDDDEHNEKVSSFLQTPVPTTITTSTTTDNHIRHANSHQHLQHQDVVMVVDAATNADNIELLMVVETSVGSSAPSKSSKQRLSDEFFSADDGSNDGDCEDDEASPTVFMGQPKRMQSAIDDEDSHPGTIGPAVHLLPPTNNNTPMSVVDHQMLPCPDSSSPNSDSDDPGHRMPNCDFAGDMDLSCPIALDDDSTQHFPLLPTTLEKHIRITDEELANQGDELNYFEHDDVQSMDAIERRDIEEEHKITGVGGLMRCRSTMSSTHLNLSVINPFNKKKYDQKVVNELAATTPIVASSPPAGAGAKLATTPTSSRTKLLRFGVATKCTAAAKINLSESLEKAVLEDADGFDALPSRTKGPNDKVTTEAAEAVLSIAHRIINKLGTVTAVDSIASSSSANSATTMSAAVRIRLSQQKFEPSVFNFNCSSSNDTTTSADKSTYCQMLASKIEAISEALERGTLNSLSGSKTPPPLAKVGGTNDGSDNAPTGDFGSTSNASNSGSNICSSSSNSSSSNVSKTNNFRSNISNSLSNCSYSTRSEASTNTDVADPAIADSAEPLRKDNAQQVGEDDEEEDEEEGAADDVAANPNEASDVDGSANVSSSDDVHPVPKSQAALMALENYEDDTWADCVEMSDTEEVCTCRDYSDESSSEDEETEPSNKASERRAILDTTPHSNGRKRRVTEPTDDQSSSASFNGDTTPGKRKRLMTDGITSPYQLHLGTPSTPTTNSIACLNSPSLLSSSNSERRTPRSLLIPTRDNPPPELASWLQQFMRWSHAERMMAADHLIELSEPSQVRHMMKVIEPQFQRDFISLLPKELALQVLTFLDPRDLLRAAQTCHSWRFLCDDNLLWKEKCKNSSVVIEPSTDRPKRGRAGNMPHISSPWKAAYMRQTIIEMNWRSRSIRDPKVLKGHDDHVITCLQFCGNRIVSGSDDNTLKVWSAITGKCLRTLVGHTGGVWSSQMAGNCIISGSTDRTLKVWNADTGHCTHTLYGHTSTVRCMHLHGNLVVSGSRDATLRVWDIDLGKCLYILVGHLAAVRCVQYDGKLVVSGAYDYLVKVWVPERQECIHTLQGHTNRVYSLQFDGIHVVSGSLDTSIRVWEAATGTCKHTLMGHQSLTSGMELRQNILVSGNADSTVKVWDIMNGQCLQTLSGPNKHQSAVTCLQFNSRFVITSSDDGTVKLWDVRTGDFIRNLVSLDSGGSGGVVWRIRANDTKLICAVGSRNGTEETKLMVLDFDVEGACLKCS